MKEELLKDGGIHIRTFDIIFKSPKSYTGNNPDFPKLSEIETIINESDIDISNYYYIRTKEIKFGKVTFNLKSTNEYTSKYMPSEVFLEDIIKRSTRISKWASCTVKLKMKTISKYENRINKLNELDI